MLRHLPQPICALLCLGVAAIALVGPAALAEPRAEDGIVFTPDVGPRVEAAFARAEPEFHLQDAAIKPKRIDAHVCRPDGRCLDVVLTPPDQTCVGQKLPSWCVTFPAGTPPDATALLHALGGVAAPSVALEAAGLSTAQWLLIWWAIPLLVAGVAALGFRLVRRRRASGLWAALLPFALLPPCGVLLSAQLQTIGAMDGAAMACVCAFAWLLLGHDAGLQRGRWLLALGSLTLSLLLLEGALRVGEPPPVVQQSRLSLLADPSPRPDGLPVSAGNQLVHCALHAEVGEETARCLRLTHPQPGAPFVIHLGDSMLFGSGVAPESALPTQLARLLPNVQHLNAGIPGTSIDTELALLQRMSAFGQPAGVILYAMPGNDADEVEAPTESCNNQPPLLLHGDSAQLRCPQPVWPKRSWPETVLQSRLPLPIAALSGTSWLARFLVNLQHQLVEPPRAHEAHAPPDGTRYRAYLRALAAYVKTLHVPLQIVVMPLRRSLYKQHTEPRRAQLIAALKSVDAPLLDTQAVVDAWVARQGENAVFLDVPRGDIHLNAQGLSRLADWLAPQLSLPNAATPSH